jgi:uncharacterized coiled-coil protein SlyX
MRRTVYSVAALVVIAGASGCNVPTGLKLPGNQTTPVQTASASVLTGAVMAPSGIIAAGGGNVISAGGGNVIAPGGGNLRVLALSERALADTEVFLADAAGEPLPGVKAVKTDAKGQFKFENVPDGYTFVVAARCKTAEGKDATLQTMTRPSKLGATANISAATTLVTAAVVEGQSDLGAFNAAKFRTAAEATAKNLSPDAMPDLADRTKILAAVAELQETVAELKLAIEEIRADLKDLKDSLEALKKELANRQPAPPPAGTQPPPPGTEPGMMPPPPPPGGTMPPPPDGQMQPPQAVEHAFGVKDVPADHFPLKVRIVVPTNGQVWAEFTFNSASDRPIGKLPEGPPHTVEFSSPKGQATAPNFVVPVGAPRDLVLPTPHFGAPAPGDTTTAGTTTSGTTTGTTSGTTTRAPISRDLTIKVDGRAPFFQNATYPIVVEFFAPDGRSLKRFSIASRTEASVQAMPCGVKGKLVYTPAGGRPASLLDFGFPEAGPVEFFLPGPGM